ncbi:MAG: helix-turn-helix domain-containing protein [Gammaproteobacteria bacterium]|nr:helix-turn-helix domain-containing protein [Gammaproteobacteria bacterium]
MDSIPLVRSTWLLPFISYLQRGGAYPARYLRSARLPTRLVDPTNDYISIRSGFQFIDIVANAEGIDHFALRVGEALRLEDIGNLREQIVSAPTLYSALVAYCAAVKKESTHSNYWVMQRGQETWMCRGDTAGLGIDQRLNSLFALMLMKTVISMYFGKKWRPSAVYLQIDDLRGLQISEPLSQADIRGGHPFTAIVLPASLTSETMGKRGRPGTVQSMVIESGETARDPQLTFAGSLRQVLRPYLSEEADIILAADLAGVSVRTLQRRLKQSGLSFSDMLQQTRFEAACSLLEDPDIRLTDIAFDIGYSDQAHFTRAFHRWAGVSPSVYRTTQCLSS